MRIIKKIPKVNSLINIIFLITYGILFVYSYEYIELGKWILLTVIFYNIFLIFKFNKSQILAIILIFISSYWVYLVFYFFMEIPYSNYYSYQTLENSVFVLRLQSLFFILLMNFIEIPNNKLKVADRLNRKNNYIIYYACIFIMILINIFGFKGGNIFSGVYGKDVAGRSILEYYIIFFIIAYIYNKNSKVKDRLLIILNIIYICNLFLHGLRLVSIEIIVMTFILFFDFKFKFKYIVLVSSIGFIFFSMLASIRVGELGEWKEIFGIYNGVLQSNQGDVFQASAVHVGMTRENIFDISYRMKAFLGVFANIFLPPALQIKETILNQNLGVFAVGGGGLISGYLYVYMGYFGVIFIPIIMAKCINKAFYGKKQIGIIYGIFILITFARWYPYSIFILIKVGFWLSVIYYISKMLHSITINRR